MTLCQLEFENSPLIRALRSETNFAKVLEVVENCKPEELSTRCPVTSATALYYAVQRREPEEALRLAQLLVGEKKACQAEQTDRNLQTPLFFAGRDGNLKCVEYLISQGCPVGQRDSASQTVLFYAARDGRSVVVKYLLDVQCMEVNAVDHLGQTALFYASRDGRVETVSVMLQRGANPNIKDKQKQTARMYALRNGHKELAALLKNAVSSGSNFKSSSTNKAGSLKRETRVEPVRQKPAEPRRRYRLQFKAPPFGFMSEDKTVAARAAASAASAASTDGPKSEIWLCAPTAKLLQFELLFPKIAVWPRGQAAVEEKPQSNPFVSRWQRQAAEIVDDLSSYEGGWIFSKPVDCRSWHCPDYYQIVSKPMDFSTIKKKLKSGSYTKSPEFVADVQLVFSNCYLYNRPDSNIGKIGANLEMYFRNVLMRTDFDSWQVRREEVDKYLTQLEAILTATGTDTLENINTSAKAELTESNSSSSSSSVCGNAGSGITQSSSEACTTSNEQHLVDGSSAAQEQHQSESAAAATGSSEAVAAVVEDNIDAPPAKRVKLEGDALGASQQPSSSAIVAAANSHAAVTNVNTAAELNTSARPDDASGAAPSEMASAGGAATEGDTADSGEASSDVLGRDVAMGAAAGCAHDLIAGTSGSGSADQQVIVADEGRRRDSSGGDFEEDDDDLFGEGCGSVVL